MNEQDIREREHQEDLQRLRGLRPVDDDFMRCLFRENIPLTQLVLRIITGKNDLVITSVETQADFKRLVGARSVCLDAYGSDSENKKYDIEVQRSDKGAEVRRARYNSSVMDVENLDAGEDFNSLPETFTIFITENDVYQLGKALYPIERMNLASGKPFDDGEHILYVNGAYRGDDPIGRLMHDFSCSDPNDMNYKELADRSRYFKETQEGVETMCKAMEDMRTKKEQETRIADIKSLMKNLKLSASQAMDALNVPKHEQELYVKQLG